MVSFLYCIKTWLYYSHHYETDFILVCTGGCHSITLHKRKSAGKELKIAQGVLSKIGKGYVSSILMAINLLREPIE